MSDDDDDTDLDYNPNPSRAFQSGASGTGSQADTRKKDSKPAPGKIYTLRDAANENDDEDEDNTGQAFYAGGSETSGQQILGPSKKNNEHIIKDLFKKAKE